MFFHLDGLVVDIISILQGKQFLQFIRQTSKHQRAFFDTIWNHRCRSVLPVASFILANRGGGSKDGSRIGPRKKIFPSNKLEFYSFVRWRILESNYIRLVGPWEKSKCLCASKGKKEEKKKHTHALIYIYIEMKRLNGRGVCCRTGPWRGSPCASNGCVLGAPSFKDHVKMRNIISWGGPFTSKNPCLIEFIREGITCTRIEDYTSFYLTFFLMYE